MNLVYRYISIHFLVIIYCFAVFANSDIYSCSDSIDKTSNQNDSFYFSNAKLNLLGYADKNEKVGNNINNLPVSFGNKRYYDFSSNTHSRELYFTNIYSDYIYREKLVTNLFTNTDIIYPYHYFW